ANFYNNYNSKNIIEIKNQAYDKYISEKEYIYINVSGEIIRREFRDLEDKYWYEGLSLLTSRQGHGRLASFVRLDGDWPDHAGQSGRLCRIRSASSSSITTRSPARCCR